ncbi:hypothetical protein HH1059_15500 [Halorhodospira halochloris]|uniref:Minor curlin subunit CsgB n=1 Tax=Halorhodospira halochloris TaxID=1052 RepID=A0A110B5Y3_HALHR|nr:hypothetical protein [Halorhodospira halochloris]BAU58257.2 hypothetical protein HH1059_15500 [Halorhodospira halochloris]
MRRAWHEDNNIALLLGFSEQACGCRPQQRGNQPRLRSFSRRPCVSAGAITLVLLLVVILLAPAAVWAYELSGIGEGDLAAPELYIGSNIDHSTSNAPAPGSMDGNWASVIQTGEKHWVSIEQYGRDNIAYIQQSGEGHYAALVQQGNNNWSEIIQSGNGGHRATVNQYGNDNKASLEQVGAVAHNVEIDQIGDGNQINVRQNGAVGSYISVRQEFN